MVNKLNSVEVQRYNPEGHGIISLVIRYVRTPPHKFPEFLLRMQNVYIFTQYYTPTNALLIYHIIAFFYIKTLKMLLHISILRPSSGSTYCSLLKLHVKIVNMSLYLSVMWQHIMCLCMRCFQCRGVCRESTYLPTLKTTHTQTHYMLPHH